MVLNYIYIGSTNWEGSASSVIRSAFSERKSTTFKSPRHSYQKLLLIMWSWMMVVLTSAYKGNLLAMITRPTMKTPFSDAAGMEEQTQIKWAMWEEDALLNSYAKTKPPGTLFKRIIDQAIKCFDSYCNDEKQFGDVALVSDITSLMYIMENDFSTTGTCSYYLTQDKIMATDSALAFPVR